MDEWATTHPQLCFGRRSCLLCSYKYRVPASYVPRQLPKTPFRVRYSHF